jgi:hypothetical protein
MLVNSESGSNEIDESNLQFEKRDEHFEDLGLILKKNEKTHLNSHIPAIGSGGPGLRGQAGAVSTDSPFFRGIDKCRQFSGFPVLSTNAPIEPDDRRFSRRVPRSVAVLGLAGCLFEKYQTSGNGVPVLVVCGFHERSTR